MAIKYGYWINVINRRKIKIERIKIRNKIIS